MERISREQRGLIRKLHYKNEELYDIGAIGYQEYIENNFCLLRQVRYSNLNNEQKLLIAESICGEVNLDKFRLSIKIAQLGFN